MISHDPLTLELGNTFAAVSGNLMITLLEQSQDCVKLLGPDGRLGFMNHNGRCTMEVDDFCAIEGSHWWDLWPAESQAVVRQAVEDAVTGVESRFEAFCPTAKGTPKWWDVTVSPVRDNDGRIFQIVSFSRDMTEQVKARDMLETMAFEMQHRLRNAFAVSGAIALVSAKNAPQHAEFARDLASRYAALATAQSQMLATGDQMQSLADLLEVMTAPYPLITFACARDLQVSDRNSKVIALAIGELATNSMKYGALSAGTPVTIDAHLANGELTLEWSEAGVVKMVSDQGGEGGKGHNLIARMAKVYGGSFTPEWRDGGLFIAIKLKS